MKSPFVDKVESVCLVLNEARRSYNKTKSLKGGFGYEGALRLSRLRVGCVCVDAGGRLVGFLYQREKPES